MAKTNNREGLPDTQKALEKHLFELMEHSIEQGIKYESAVHAARRRWIAKTMKEDTNTKKGRE